MLKILGMTILLELILIVPSMAQAQVVTNPHLEAMTWKQYMVDMANKAALQSLEQTQKKAEEAVTNFRWLKQLESLQETIILMERITCTLKDLDFNLSLAADLGLINGSSCWLDFDYHINFVRLKQSIDFVNAILTDGMQMSPAERLDIYYRALAGFTDSQREFIRLKADIDVLLIRYEQQLADQERLENYYSPNNPRWEMYK